ncbi:cation-independent mannose-6-phosphate receptor-like [Physella acuta]|uniref:cation-independent mannose-6-phosphate receptor-like n=1 Tax=Physella acuta TaxID=109671 RepID=UPI0027DE6809|nr:cation-independent mannose-6-phosphate receptor-like [Physella acuta]
MAATIFQEKMGLLVCFILLSTALAEECKIGKYNITELHRFAPWYTINENTNATFEITLCGKLATVASQKGCPPETSVCAKYPNNTFVSYGNYSANQDLHEPDEGTNGEILMLFKGQPCQVAGEFYSIILYFKCGKTLGYPKYMGDFDCSAHFEWESYIFCKTMPVPDQEVPCAVVNKGSLIDLSPLIKLTGGHLVDDGDRFKPDEKLFINVCRDITPGTEPGDVTKNCSKGSSSCVVSTQGRRDFGKPTGRLQSFSNYVALVYRSPLTPECYIEPETVITFRCPQRGGSKKPTVTSYFNSTCSLMIEWVTEYACPVDYITSKDCKLTEEQHDINIDLSPLKASQANPYTVNVQEGDDSYIYNINVCAPLAGECGSSLEDTALVCQRKSEDDFAASVGQFGHTKLMYSDGDLTMIIKNGDRCRSNFRRETIIDFYCNKTAANNGLGKPEFIRHSNCSYFFSWGTSLACLDDTFDRTCSVEYQGKKFDLSYFEHQDGYSYPVMTSDGAGDLYFLNLCHDIVGKGDSSGCPAGSAVCRKGASGTFVSLGSFKQSLQYNPVSDSLQLNYTGGSAGDSCERHTLVSLYCATKDYFHTGKAETSPRLVHKSADDCFFEIEWYTLQACEKIHKEGDLCRVPYDSAGHFFDLNPLRLEKGGYEVKAEGYTYYINVCGQVQHDKYCNKPPHNNASVCQVKTDGTSTVDIKVSEPSTKLQFYDGVTSLLYTNGEPYNNPNKTRRMALISFVCDTTEEIGHPEFSMENNYTYQFIWRTSYVCKTAATECGVVDGQTHEQYDLSSLSKLRGSWEVENSEDPDKKQKFYINVCESLDFTSGPRCSPYASACVTSIDKDGKETLLHANVGKFELPPMIEKSIHGVKLVYTNGNTCTDDTGKDNRFNTTIHFACVAGKVVGGPTSPQLVSPCEYSILWETEAACPVDEVKTKDNNISACTVLDPHSGFQFNLSPLARDKGYSVKAPDGSKSYLVNLCDSLPETACGMFDNKFHTAVCEIQLAGNRTVAKFSTDLTYSSDGEITLTYTGHFNKSNYKKYEFKFICDRKAQEATVSFHEQQGLYTTFTISTALACAPQPVSCTVQDANGRQYDLTPLARETGNYVVIDTRPNHDDLQYHINVCRPVNPTPEMTCPGGSVGACQTSKTKAGSFSLGYVQSEPVVSSTSEAITLRYEGGQKCHTGTDNEAYRSTRIHFYCDPVEHNPVFEAESDTCEYSFIWKTPSACPQQLALGSDCKVTDSLYNYEFDLNPLRKVSGNYIVQTDQYSFHINLCGPLVGADDICKSSQAAACQTGSTLPAPKLLGVANSQPRYESGQISVIYTDGAGNCHGKYNRSTTIQFICDHGQTGADGPQYLEENSVCSYRFEWRTKVACPPHQVIQCTYQQGQDTYDLSRLSLASDNYMREYKDSNKIYIINVCRSLVHKKDQTCPFNAAACMIDLSESDPKKRYHSIGEVTNQSFSLDHETLILRYDNGELCGKGRRSTSILFKCNENTDGLGVPSNHFEVNGCEDNFVWESSAACPLKKLAEDNSTQGFGDCRATNPNTGYVFDLSSLKSTAGYSTTDREGHELKLNVCGWLNNSPCINGTGVCLIDQTLARTSVSAGVANGRLLYRDVGLTLVYGSGDLCSSKVPRMTYISFICNPDAGKGVPVFVDKSDDCIFHLDWHTNLVCETEVKCEVTTDTGYTLDFSSLILKTGQYSVIPDDVGSHYPSGLIYINLCRPLNPIFGTLCPPGSGACLDRSNNPPLSLGRVSQGPVYDKATKEVKLTYTNGDECPFDSKYNASSLIILKCGSSPDLAPELEEVSSSCQYLFMWKTPLACADLTSQKLGPDCSYTDHKTRTKYSLSSLHDTYTVQSSHGGTFSIKPCGQLEEKGEQGEASCAQSAVCLRGTAVRDGSYGDSSLGLFQKDDSYVGLSFSGGRKCPSGSKASSAIFFQCDRTAGSGQPKLFKDDTDCQATFLWLTDLVCPAEKKECHIASRGQLYDFTFLSQDKSSWSFTDHSNTKYWLNLCQPLHGEAIVAGCPSNAAVCRKTSDGKVEMMGQLDTQLISVDGQISNTSIVFKYSNGNTNLCSSGGRRRSDMTPTVSVKLICGSVLGSPIFNQYSPETCNFEIVWKTRLACAVDLKKLRVFEENGLVYDVRTGQSFDLKPLLAANNVYKVAVDQDMYYVKLGGPLRPSDIEAIQTRACQLASVCLKTSGTWRSLGSYTSIAYYMEDEHLEVELTSPEACTGRTNLNITTVIKFNCDEDALKTQPEFLYKTADCAYIFNWDTNVVCQDALKKGPDPRADNSDGGKGSKIAIAVSVLVGIVVVCLLVLLLYKPERRATIAFKLRRAVCCGKLQDAPIVYSRLSNSDAAEDPFNPFNDTEEEAEINNSSAPTGASPFHDDSDEDMLL